MATQIPDDPDALLTRAACAAALTAAGFPTSRDTLATKATRGGGPPFRKFGPRALYPWGSSLDWAKSKLGPIVRTTAELDLAQQSENSGSRRAGGTKPNACYPMSVHEYRVAAIDEGHQTQHAPKYRAVGAPHAEEARDPAEAEASSGREQATKPADGLVPTGQDTQ